MNYPVWELELGHGPMMAWIAVIHTFVSQFAIGAGLFLVLTEHRARRLGDAPLLAWLRRNTRPFVLLSLVFGALTGVAIWFVIGLVNPQGTSALIHAFVWGWAIEWVFFFVEIAAALLYLYGWDRLSPARHLAAGWIYFISAWLSLVVITGILSFMLTPGRWLETRDFWDGFLNPTYVPSVAARTGICIALAGGWAHLAASRERDAALRSRVARLAGGWTLAGIAITAPSAMWAWSVAVRETTTAPGASAVERIAGGTVPAAAEALRLLPWFAGAAAVIALASMILPRSAGPGRAVALLVALLASLGSIEWLREGARKPWLIRGYLYVNGAAANEVAATPGGLAATSPWLRHREPADAVLDEAGADLFRVACRSCHTVDGYRGVRALVAGRAAPWIEDALAHVDRMRGPMPAFLGNPAERRALATYLAGLTRFEEVTYEDADRTSAGGRVFTRDCAPCHGDVGTVTRAFRGLEAADAEEWIDSIEVMFEGKMPRFHGTARERVALAAFLSESANAEERGP